MPDLLEQFDLKFEDLNSAERETYMQWMQSLNNNTLTVGSVRDYVDSMRSSVEAELAGYAEPKTFWDFLFRRRKDIYRRARLRNYMLLMAFLNGPEKAKKALERSLSNIKPNH